MADLVVWANSQREPHARYRPLSMVRRVVSFACDFVVSGGQEEIRPGRGDELFTGCDLLWSEAFVLDALAQIKLLVRVRWLACFVVLLCGA